jgi:hypothetical protein
MQDSVRQPRATPSTAPIPPRTVAACDTLVLYFIEFIEGKSLDDL